MWHNLVCSLCLSVAGGGSTHGMHAGHGQRGSPHTWCPPAMSRPWQVMCFGTCHNLGWFLHLGLASKWSTRCIWEMIVASNRQLCGPISFKSNFNELRNLLMAKCLMWLCVRFCLFQNTILCEKCLFLTKTQKENVAIVLHTYKSLVPA